MPGLASVYIVSAARTPIGNFLGALSSLAAPRLGAVAIQGALKRANLPPELISEVFMGNVLSAGIGQAPARQAMIYAGLPDTIPATTISKVCGSGLQAVIFGTRAIALGDAEIVISGGMETMSNAPYYLEKARGGYRMGDGKLVDGMIFDGLWDPYNQVHIGSCGDKCAAEFNIVREAQDGFAALSYQRAQKAQATGAFKREIEPVAIAQKKGAPLIVSMDESPSQGGDLAKMATLRAAFSQTGTITAGNASSISDGASALVLASENAVKQYGLKPLAKITGYASAAQAPEWFSTAPAKAIHALCAKLGLTPQDFDLFEINEAFAVVALVCAELVGIALDRVNVRGGAVALGHPIGASGARILTTLVHAMRDQQKAHGMAAICIGGGEALALAVELV